MKPRLTFIILVLILPWIIPALYAQSERDRCLTDRYYQSLVEEAPEIQNKREEAHRQIEEQLSKQDEILSPRREITIPVVVHIVYRLPDQNISDQQVISQIDALNRDFNLQNGNRFTVQDPFESDMASVGIEFCLANRDAAGNPSSGIIRTETSVRNIGTHQVHDGRTAIHHDELGGSDAWDTDKYLNIWVGALNGYLGFGKYPGAALPGEDGVVIDPNYFGTIGQALEHTPFHLGKTTTHEVGHYFDLLHPWGLTTDECQEDDDIEDTPPQSNPNYFCPSEPQYSCGSRDMYFNFMDYTDDPCLAMFTHGQKERILATLQSYRSGLMESDGCSFVTDPAKLSKRFKVYFRSSDHRLLIERNMPEKFPIDLKVFNQIGQLVARADNIDQRLYILDHSVQSSGMYFVQLSTENESVLHKVVAIHR